MTLNGHFSRPAETNPYMGRQKYGKIKYGKIHIWEDIHIWEEKIWEDKHMGKGKYGKINI